MNKQIDDMVTLMCEERKKHKSCKACKSGNSNANAYCRIEHYAETLYNADYRKAISVATEIFDGVMQAIEEGTKNATSTLKQSITTHEKLLVSTGEMYSGFVGKAICQFFKKYESEGADDDTKSN